MSAREIPYRIREQGRMRGRKRFTLEPFGDTWNPSIGLDLFEALRAIKGTAALWSEAASTVREGNIKVFGRTWPTDRGLPLWDIDARSGESWPLVRTHRVGYRSTRDGGAEAREVWELQRFRYLLGPAFHARSHSDAELVELVRAHIRSWLRAHPQGIGIGWATSIEVALRVVTLSIIESVTADIRPDPEFRSLVTNAVIDHVAWIRAFPSLYSSANNHRVAELMALIASACTVRGIITDVELAQNLIEVEDLLLLLFRPDGGNAEQATSYGLFTLEMVTIMDLATRALGSSLSDRVRRRVAAGVEFSADMRSSTGSLVVLGDDDGSHVFLSLVRERDEVHVLSSLLGCRPPERSRFRSYVESGVTVARTKAAHRLLELWFDHGSLGYGSIAAHGHSDTLAIWVQVDGMPLFAEAGTYGYHAAGRLRQMLRSAGVHNTARLDGLEPSVTAGGFNWHHRYRANGRLIMAESISPRGFRLRADHDGYMSRLGVCHERTLEYEDSVLAITDRVDRPTRAMRAEVRYLIPGAFAVESSAGHAFRITLENSPVCTVVFDGEAVTAKLMSGAPGSCVPFSPKFGILEPASVLSASAEVGSGASLRTIVKFEHGKSE